MHIINPEKAKALQVALAQIEKQFGKGTIMRLGEGEVIEDIQVVSTGSLGLDIALGVGGLPRGRVVEIYGPESSGKTTLTLQVMARNVDVPLALSHLAARDQVSAAHVHITRHLSLRGDRLGDLAGRAGMTKQAMGALVDQCEAWGLVERRPDPLDARARRVQFTPTGHAWLRAFQSAVAQAEAELRAEVGDEVAAVVAIGLETYASGNNPA